MDKYIDRLKREFDKNPTQVVAAAGVLVGAVAKLWQAHNNSISRRTWDREVARRERMGRR